MYIIIVSLQSTTSSQRIWNAAQFEPISGMPGIELIKKGAVINDTTYNILY